MIDRLNLAAGRKLPRTGERGTRPARCRISSGKTSPMPRRGSSHTGKTPPPGAGGARTEHAQLRLVLVDHTPTPSVGVSSRGGTGRRRRFDRSFRVLAQRGGLSFTGSTSSARCLSSSWSAVRASVSRVSWSCLRRQKVRRLERGGGRRPYAGGCPGRGAPGTTTGRRRLPSVSFAS